MRVSKCLARSSAIASVTVRPVIAVDQLTLTNILLIIFVQKFKEPETEMK